MAAYLGLVDLASALGISRQAILKAVQEIADGRRDTWHGAALDIRVQHGAGGRSGLRYEVKVSSLPEHLQARLKADQTALEVRSTPAPGSKASAERKFWLHHLGPIINLPKRSPERTVAIDALTGTKILDWKGRRRRLSRSAVTRKLKQYEDEGLLGLVRKSNGSRGQKRVVISRAWDAAVSGRIEPETMQAIARMLRQYIRGLVKSGETGKWCRQLASRHLKMLTRDYGFRPNDPDGLERACKVPESWIRAEKEFKAVHRHKRDRKASEDNMPRITRTTAGMRPMECVVMDVHHTNVLVPREDGTTATAKLMGFLDVATRRIWCDLVFLEKGGGVRNLDVIQAFKAMAEDPSWGLPENLHLDNGKEYGFADFIDDALKLAHPISGTGRQMRIIRSLPYNAAAKPIEALFGHLEQTLLKHLQGYIGDDRMNPKQEKLGKLPAPYPGGFEAFHDVFESLVNAYEVMPQQGELKGLSPRLKFKRGVEDGWAAVVIDPDDFDFVFSTTETRKVSQHGVRVDGRRWTCPELDAYLGDTVIVRIPKYHGFNRLRIERPDGSFLGIAIPDEEFAYLDPRGAKRSAERKAIARRAIRERDRSAPTVDVVAEKIAYGNDHLPVIPNEPRGKVRVTPDGPPVEMIDRGRSAAPSEAESEAEEERQMELIREARRALLGPEERKAS